MHSIGDPPGADHRAESMEGPLAPLRYGHTKPVGSTPDSKYHKKNYMVY